MKKKTSFLSNKLLLFSLSLLISLSIWIYITSVITVESTKTFTNVPVELIGEDTIQRMYDLVITDLDTTTVSFEITGPKRIVNSMDAEDLVAQVDVGKLSRPGITTLNYTIVYPSGVDRRDLTVGAKSRDSITFIVSKIVSKSIQVTGGFAGNVSEGYVQGTPTFEPSTITISGPDVYVQEVDHAYVTFGKEQTLESTYSLDTGFTLMDSEDKPCATDYITCSHDTIRATLPVSVIRELAIHVRTSDFSAGATPDNTKITYEPETIRIAGDSAALAEISNMIELNDIIDLTSFASKYTATYPIPLPNDLKNLSGATEATVTIEITGLETRVFDVDKNDVQFHWIGLPENMDVDILSDMIKICLRGEKTYLDAVTPQDIVIEADLSSLIENAAGGYQTVVVSVTVPSIPEVGAIRDQGKPEYELVFRLVEKKVEETA